MVIDGGTTAAAFRYKVQLAYGLVWVRSPAIVHLLSSPTQQDEESSGGGLLHFARNRNGWMESVKPHSISTSSLSPPKLLSKDCGGSCMLFGTENKYLFLRLYDLF